MMHTCSLDVAYSRLAERSVAVLLGVTEQGVDAETKNVLRKLRGSLTRFST
jgi:hypothetical protein